jgi:hypothetical protein
MQPTHPLYLLLPLLLRLPCLALLHRGCCYMLAEVQLLLLLVLLLLSLLLGV